MFKVVCIDDKGRPNEIPLNQWIKLNKVYTVIQISKCLMQDGILGFKLEEVNLNGCFPYEFYAASRFRLLKEDEVQTEELVEELTLN